ncbi:hypothetical protein OCU04_002929 [Sclerotinia nivalis]|uniref:Uncharacterized protein n=1 Tax=Sclerotinia nivalis TaxID=352851 RepID=A0A9X0AUN0_9HELO|nr:hypothetical protein OCU04_002929 [Sclerotinia nivalis]
MSEIEDDVPFLLRDRRIKAVRDRFHRPPTANELRAIDALPLEPRRNLNDTSPNGQKIYDLLKAFEKSGYVEGLEEAGRLLWAQVFAEPDFSQMPRREPISITRDIATSGYVEVRCMASRRPASQPKEKPAQQSAAEKVLSINTTSNAFAGSPQKSWMTKGVSVSPSPRRASISSTENDKNNEPATSDFQPQYTPPIPFRPAQSGQQTQNHASTFVNQVPGASPNIYNSGVYTPWPLHSNSQQHQYASPYSIQGPTNSMSSILERGDPTRDPISRVNYTSNELNEYNPSMVNLYDPTESQSHYFATLGAERRDPNPLSYSTPQHPPSGYPNSGMSSPGNNYAHPTPPSMRQHFIQPSNDTVYPNHTMTGSSRTPYDPSTPPFHPAISSQAQALFFSRKEAERDELARITSNIHQSLSSLPDSHENQQVASSSRMAAANTLANMANTDRTTQLTPGASTYQSPSSATTSMTPGQSSNNPFVIRDDMGFIHSQDLTYQDPNPTPINPQPTTSDRNSASSSTNLTATVPNPPQPTSKKARTPLPNTPRPQFGKLIPENPISGTIFSTNTKHDLLVSKAKKESIKKALIPLPPAFTQIDGASDPASYQHDTTDYARLPTKDLNVDLDVQANYMSHLPPSQEPSFSYPDPSTNTAAEFTFFDPYNDDEDTYTEQPVYIPPSYLAHLPQPPRHLFQPTPSRPPPPAPHLRPHTPEYLLFPPVAASSTKKPWPRPPSPIEGYRQFTFVRDRISLQLSAKRRTEINLDTGEYRYAMDSQETNRGYKMDGTRIRTDERFFRKKRMTKKVLAKMELERVEEEERRKKECLHEAIRPEYGDMFRRFREDGEVSTQLDLQQK